MAVENENTAPVNSNFIRTLIEEDIEKGATVPVNGAVIRLLIPSR